MSSIDSPPSSPARTPETGPSGAARRWGGDPLRWLLGGCWGLWRLPLRGLLYGGVFFATAWIWGRTLSALTAPGLGRALGITALTLLLAPRLTAGLLDGMARGPGGGDDGAARERRGALLGLGALLVLLLALALHLSLLGFALLYRGEVPALDGLPGAVFSWRNAPLALLLILILTLAALGMQAVAVIPTFVVRELDPDLPRAILRGARASRRHWRPLVCWALSSQVLLFVGGGLMPVALVLLAPAIACGSWWAFRDTLARTQVPDGPGSGGDRGGPDRPGAGRG
jgi:hypothetical protein